MVDSQKLRVGYNRVMKTTRQLTAIIEREDDAYVALCPELDIASQGDTVETEEGSYRGIGAVFQSADPTEIARRLHSEVFITRVEVRLGKLRVLSGREVCKLLEAEGFSQVRQRGLKSVRNGRRA